MDRPKKQVEQVADDTDPDGLPRADAAFFAALETDALTARPKATDWAVLVAGLRWAAEVGRRGGEAGDAPPGTTASRLALKAVLAFLEKQDCVMRHGASMPLAKIQGALTDLAQGRVSPMFKPPVKANGNPGKGKGESLRMGIAARAMSELMDGGDSEDDAARQVAGALGGKMRPATVRNWRARLNQGPGPGAPQEAIDHFKAPLPSWPDSTPTMRGKRLLEILKERSALL